MFPDRNHPHVSDSALVDLFLYARRRCHISILKAHPNDPFFNRGSGLNLLQFQTLRNSDAQRLFNQNMFSTIQNIFCNIEMRVIWCGDYHHIGITVTQHVEVVCKISDTFHAI